MPIKIKKTIVIVEDESVLLKALNIEVLNAGFEVLVAMDGKSGLNLIKANKPDLVLLDLLLPKMDGYAVLAALKKDSKTKDIPVVILSNFGEPENIEKAMELGAVDYFVKSSTDLGEVVKKIDQRII